MVGVELGRGNGGPYKTISQCREALGGNIVSLSKADTIQVPGDGITHLICRSRATFQRLMWLPPTEQRKLSAMIQGSSHSQCHIPYRFHAYYIWRESFRLGKPYWVIPHGCLDPYVFTYRRGQKLFWMWLFGRILLRDAAYVVFASNREMRKAKHWLSRDNGRVVRWPVTIPDKMRNIGDGNALRASLGIERDTRILLWLGRLHPMKRPVESAVLFSKIAGPKTHLVFVGNDDAGLGAKLAEVIRSCRYKNIHWRGPAYGDAKDKILRGCDGYWSYSIRENFNHTAAESMAVGLPVLLSAGNDLAEDLLNENVGWILNSDKESSVSDALRAWEAVSGQVLTEIGTKGRLWATRNLSPETFASTLKNMQNNANSIAFDGRRRIEKLWEAYIKTMASLFLG